jgi:hypothetical protein
VADVQRVAVPHDLHAVAAAAEIGVANDPEQGPSRRVQA